MSFSTPVEYELPAVPHEDNSSVPGPVIVRVP